MRSILDNPVTLFLVSMFLLILAIEFGILLAQLTHASLDDVRRQQIYSTRDAMLVLLSLLLGFTLALGEPRFERRRQLVVDESNAIGTTILRAEMLPEPARTNVESLLRRYVDSRLAFFRAANDSKQIKAALDDSDAVQAQLWQQAVSVSQSNPTPITALFVSTLNDTIDLDAKRREALEDHIPTTVWVMLASISLLTSFTVGFAMPRRFWFSILVTPLMISVVLALIADVDAPRSGFIQISQRSMERLQSSLHSRTDPEKK